MHVRQAINQAINRILVHKSHYLVTSFLIIVTHSYLCVGTRENGATLILESHAFAFLPLADLEVCHILQGYLFTYKKPVISLKL